MPGNSRAWSYWAGSVAEDRICDDYGGVHLCQDRGVTDPGGPDPGRPRWGPVDEVRPLDWQCEVEIGTRRDPALERRRETEQTARSEKTPNEMEVTQFSFFFLKNSYIFPPTPRNQGTSARQKPGIKNELEFSLKMILRLLCFPDLKDGSKNSPTLSRKNRSKVRFRKKNSI